MNNISEVRKRLRDGGYDPIPVRGKNPGMKAGWAWEKIQAPTDDQIAMWSKAFPDAINTGILTKRSPCFDIDILVPEAAEAVETLAREYTESGITLVRFGLAPKRSIPLHTDAPFSKISVALRLEDGIKQGVECLGNGQQTVVDGIHPDTRQPYKWHGGNLHETRLTDLPLVDHTVATEFVNKAVALLVDDFGYTVAKTGSRTGTRNRSRPLGLDLRAEPTTFWGRVNQAALANLDKWVPKLFPEGFTFYPNNPAGPTYRISPKALKREFEEDLSITPNGIVDWAVWDVGDEREGRRTPIDIVLEWGGAPDAKAAAFWLCEQIGLEPDALGWGEHGVRLGDLHAYMPMHTYIYAPTREMWPAASVNARLGTVPILNADGTSKMGDKGKPIVVPAATWLDQNQPVEQMTWAPGLPLLIKNRLVNDGGWIERGGVTMFNQYRAPTIHLGVASRAQQWLDHVHRVFPDNADQIVKWLAFKVQRPEIKINHALVLGGYQGIGKDTILEPVKKAVGESNFAEVSPQDVLDRFNSFAKSVILRINEVRNLGDVDRFALYEHMKVYIASPPDMLRVNEKHIREYYAFNVMGVIFTTNHKIDGIYLPSDDRRHYVAWSELRKADFTDEYWDSMWGWYEKRGGYSDVAAYLHELNLEGFNPKAPPPKTDAFWQIAAAGVPEENADLRDLLDRIGNPPAVTVERLRSASEGDLAAWFHGDTWKRTIRHRLSEVGYDLVPNPGTADGRWKVAGKNAAVYARSQLSAQDRRRAAARLAGTWA